MFKSRTAGAITSFIGFSVYLLSPPVDDEDDDHDDDASMTTTTVSFVGDTSSRV